MASLWNYQHPQDKRVHNFRHKTVPLLQLRCHVRFCFAFLWRQKIYGNFKKWPFETGRSRPVFELDFYMETPHHIGPPLPSPNVCRYSTETDSDSFVLQSYLIFQPHSNARFIDNYPVKVCSFDERWHTNTNTSPSLFKCTGEDSEVDLNEPGISEPDYQSNYQMTGS